MFPQINSTKTSVLTPNGEFTSSLFSTTVEAEVEGLNQLLDMYDRDQLTPLDYTNPLHSPSGWRVTNYAPFLLKFMCWPCVDIVSLELLKRTINESDILRQFSHVEVDLDKAQEIIGEFVILQFARITLM